MNSVIHNAQIFDGDRLLQDHAVIINDGLVEQLLPQSEVPSDIEQTTDLMGNYLVPGFIDLQINGGGGVLFNNAPTLDSICAIGQAHRQFGTTGFLPTLITDSFEVMEQAIAAVAQAIEQSVPGVLGIHLE